MFHLIILVDLILWASVESTPKKEGGSSESDSDLDVGIVPSLRNEANLDLSADEEYEDLRAELLAYHTALASLSSQTQSRKSMMTTPCWALGGICVHHSLCIGFRSLTEVAGCRDRFNVCCLAWNKYEVKDMKDKGIGSLAMPWSPKQEFGGEGVLDVEKKQDMKKKRKHRKGNEKKQLALIIKTQA